MSTLITGMHHVTAMASGAQSNLDFYTGVLGLRLLKQTVNFDAPDVYHFYYGNEVGDPGTIMTFFPFPQMARGRKGRSQTVRTSFSVPEGALEFWMERLRRFGIGFAQPEERFNEQFIYFEDWDGLGLELVAHAGDTRLPFSRPFIPESVAIRGFHHVELSERVYEATEELLVNMLDYDFVGESGARRRYAPRTGSTGFLDLVWDAHPDFGSGGTGTVHHIAFDTASEEDQLVLRERLLRRKVFTTQVLDRQYFKSIYFREPGGVLFEVATSGPGFAWDEPVAALGQELKLPPWVEAQRAAIEAQLEQINQDITKYA